MSNACILITGGTGFVGSHLVEYLLSTGQTNAHVTAYGSLDSFVSTLLPPEQIHNLDLTDQIATAALFQELKPTVVYHLAAFSSVGSSFEIVSQVIQNNTQLQLNVLDAIRQITPQARALIIGSAEEYGVSEPSEIPISEVHPLRPSNPYAVSKVTQDLLAYAYTQAYDLDIVRVRPFNHTGERQSTAFAIPAFIEQIIKIEQGKQATLHVGNLEAVRDFTDVKDVVAAYNLLVEHGLKGEVYNLGSGQGRSLREVVELLQSFATCSIALETDASRLRPSDVPVMIADSSKIRALGWKPSIPLETTLERMLEWTRLHS